jgi:hypothetical protein
LIFIDEIFKLFIYILAQELIMLENKRMVVLVFTSLRCPSLLLSLCAVIPAPVARIAPVGSDLDTGSMALITYRTILFHMGGLLLLIHGD